MKRLRVLLALLFIWSVLPALPGWATPVILDLIVKGTPYVDLRAYMDGKEGRPKLEQWLSDNTIDLTDVFNAAYAAAKVERKGVEIPCGHFEYTGLLYDTLLPFIGKGNCTEIKNTSADNNWFTIHENTYGYMYGFGVIGNFNLVGDNVSSGSVFSFDTQGRLFIDKVYTLDTGGRVFTLGATQHAVGLSVSNFKAQRTVGDVVYGRSNGNKQINDISFLNFDFSDGQSNGFNVWPTAKFSAQHGVVQGFDNAGIRVEADGYTSASTTVNTTMFDDIYQEANKGGDIRVKGGQYTGGVSALVSYISFTNIFVNGEGSVRSVLFSRRGDGTSEDSFLADTVRSMTWKGNIVSSGTTGMDVIDFDNALGELCEVSPVSGNATNLTRSPADNEAKVAKYINLGAAKFNAPKSLVVPGVYYAVSDNITYSSLTSRVSDNVTSASTVQTVDFQIPLPDGAILLNAAIPVYWTDNTKACDIGVALYRADVNGLAALTSMGGASYDNQTNSSTTVPFMAKWGGINAYSLDLDAYRAGYTKQEWILSVTIKTNSGSTDAVYRLGNPIIRYN